MKMLKYQNDEATEFFISILVVEMALRNFIILKNRNYKVTICNEKA